MMVVVAGGGGRGHRQVVAGGLIARGTPSFYIEVKSHSLTDLEILRTTERTAMILGTTQLSHRF